MAKRTPEGEIKNQIFQFLYMNQIFCWSNASVGIFDPTRKIYRKSNSPFQIKGTSDILGILPDGRFLAIEVKNIKPKTYPTPEQKLFIEQVLHRNGIAFVARSVEDVARVLSPYLKVTGQMS